MSAHWTSRSIADFVYRISSDFILQIEAKMGQGNINQSKIAEALGVTDGRVSQVFTNPGNLTLKKMVEYAQTVGMKVSVVAYEDNDPGNQNGPIHSGIFNLCWERAGRPSNFTLLDIPQIVAPPRMANHYLVPTGDDPFSEDSGQGFLPVMFNASSKESTRGTLISKGAN
ncbi:MAG: helix-turn-helix domain-containing protein [Candidatus Acidiferrales bacterium]